MTSLATRAPSSAPPVAALALLIVLVAVYWPGLGGPFLADDMPNILANPFVQIERLDLDTLGAAVASNSSGPLKRPLAAASFSLNYWFAGQRFDNFAFKATNLCIHLLNVLLALWLVRRILRAGGLRTGAALQWTAFVAVALWALHPLQLTAVLYVVQRMTMLAATFSMLGLAVFLVGRTRLGNRRRGGYGLMALGVVGGAGLGAMAKENALLLPGMALVIELTLYRCGADLAGRRGPLVAFYLTTAVGPYLLGALGALLVFDLWSAQYALRDFDLGDRLMTQARVTFWYLGQLLVPDLSALSIYHDDWTVSRSLTEPAATLWAVLGWPALLLLGVLSLRYTVWLAFGLLWFVNGHLLESTVVPLELVYEHRNYLPSLGVLTAMAALGTTVLARGDAPKLMSRLVPAVLIAALAAATFVRAGTWSDAQSLVNATVAKHPRSARAHATQARMYEALNVSLDQIYAAYHAAARLSPRALDARVGMLRVLALISVAKMAEDSDDTPARFLAADGTVLLEITPEAVGAARRRLNEAVHGILARGVPGVGAVASVSGIVECIERSTPQCVELRPDVHGWLTAVAGNPDLDTYARQTFLWLRARLSRYEGRDEEALGIMTEAVALEPEQLILQHQRASMLILTGRLDAAAAAIEALARKPGSARHRLEVIALGRMLDEARAR